MARGRKPNVTPSVQWSIMVPIDLAFRVEAALMDPVTKSARYGSRSVLIQALLHEWLQREGMSQVPLDTLEGAGDNPREEAPIPPATISEPNT